MKQTQTDNRGIVKFPTLAGSCLWRTLKGHIELEQYEFRMAQETILHNLESKFDKTLILTLKM